MITTPALVRVYALSPSRAEKKEKRKKKLTSLFRSSLLPRLLPSLPYRPPPSLSFLSFPRLGWCGLQAPDCTTSLSQSNSPRTSRPSWRNKPYSKTIVPTSKLKPPTSNSLLRLPRLQLQRTTPTESWVGERRIVRVDEELLLGIWSRRRGWKAPSSATNSKSTSKEEIRRCRLEER